MPTRIYRNFGSGELSPSMYAREDTPQYQQGLRTCRNFFIARDGGAVNRPGTKFLCEVKDSTKVVKLIPFVFNETQTYMLEFGHLYMRVIKNGAQGQETASAIVSITKANPGVVRVTAHGYSTGDEVYIQRCEGMIDLNKRNFTVTVIDGDNFSLNYMDGTAVNTTTFPTYTTALNFGLVARVYTIASPYLSTDLALLKYTQSADVIELVHPLYPPYQLTRTGDLSWAFNRTTFLPTIDRPTALSGAAASVSGAAVNHQYKVTAIAKSDGAESLPAIQNAKVITNITKADPAVVTSALHGYNNGDEVLIRDVVGMTEVNEQIFIVANQAANTFELMDLDSTGYTAYSSGGNAYKTLIDIFSDGGTLAAPDVISWTGLSTVQKYLVYRNENGQFGFLGEAVGSSFNDIGAGINGAKTPPIYANPFFLSGDYPSAVGYHSQRLAFASTLNDPLKVWESRVGQYHDFSISSPVEDDDAVRYTLAGTRVSKIRNFSEAGTFFAFTGGAEYNIEGEGGGNVTPFAINVKRQSAHGSSDLVPINVDRTVLFVTAKGNRVRDLNYNWQITGYQGSEISNIADHLFKNRVLVDWAFQEDPNLIIWCVRDDGVMLGMTYVRDLQVNAWHHHDTDGYFENVQAIPEGQSDAVYVVVRRSVTLNGVARTVRYIERMADRNFEDVTDAVFTDSTLDFDGRSVIPATAKFTGSAYTPTDLVTVSLSGVGFFISSDVGNQLFVTCPDGTEIRFTISDVTSTTVVKGFPNRNIPASAQNVFMSGWRYAVNEVGGLWHLEGKKVSITGDGFVVASPFNPTYTQRTVTNGKVTLSESGECYSYVHVGLPFDSDLQTLDQDTAQGPSRVDKAKIVSKVTLFLQDSRGMFVGDRPPTDTTTDHKGKLAEPKIRELETMDSPVDLITQAIEVIVGPKWNKNGRVFVRQIDPLPCSVLAIAPNGLT